MFFGTDFAANVSQEGRRTRPTAGAERQEAMSSSMINPVGRVGLELIGSLNRPEQKQRPAVKQQEAKAAYSSVAANSGATQLQFRVDEKTNDVTIMIMDKATDKVIRTIPPEAIKDIPVGQLMEYST